MTLDDRVEAAGARRSRPADRLQSQLLWTGLVLMALALIVAIPRGAGPDEQDHVARGAALVRGQLDGESDWPMTSYVYFQIPWWVTEPSPTCYAFRPEQPASCSVVPSEIAAPTLRHLSQTASYPPSAHILAGAATLLPGEARTQWLARLFNAVVPIGLFGWALQTIRRCRNGRLISMGATLALTPGVWFFAAVVNPSGWTAAGALAMWTALLLPRQDLPAEHAAKMWVVGCCALMLARFDGVPFAVLLTIFGVMWGGDGLFGQVMRRVQLFAPLVVSCLANVLWSAHYGRRQWLLGGRYLQLGFAALTVAAAISLVRSSRVRDRLARSADWARSRSWLLALVVVVLPIVGFVSITAYRQLAFAAAVGNTGNSFDEAVGVLAWADTLIPDSAFTLWYLLLGTLIGIALFVGSPRRCGYLVTLVGSVVAFQWLLQTELSYWHGRYLFPITLGIPLVAAVVASSPDRAESASNRVIERTLGVGIWLVWMLGFAQMIRRFAVSSVGVMDPTRWNTYTIVHPIVLLCGFALGAAMLIASQLGELRVLEATRRGSASSDRAE